MRDGDHSYAHVHLAAWNITNETFHQVHFHATYLKLITTSFLPVGQL